VSAQLSICIPTRNRAALLRNCLSHLKGFRKLGLEVIVFDNASDDDTRKVVRDFQKGAFARFVYHRHAENIGPARNMDAALRLATAPYAWVLSDDDIAYEEALLFMVGCLESSASVVAVCGGYDSGDRMNVGFDNFKAPELVAVIGKGDIEKLAANVLVTDGHPVMRREIFQRHCRMEERGFGLFPLYGRLLRYGDVVHVNAPVMGHLRNPDSLTTNLTEPWFIDYVNGDIELALAGAEREIPLAVLEGAKNPVQGTLYLHAARMARIQGDALLMRHFLLRAKAVHKMDEASLMHWEAAFLIDAAMQRTAQMLRDVGAKRVFVEDHPTLGKIAAQLALMRPELDWRARRPDPRAAGEPHDVRMYWSADAAADRPAGDASPAFSFMGIVDGCRVTRSPISIESGEDGSCGVRYLEPEAAELLAGSPRLFQILMEDYGVA
jgi:hypothetical protein